MMEGCATADLSFGWRILMEDGVDDKIVER